MATKIVTKNSSTASAVPTASDLLQGELAVNVADKRLFTEDNAGAIVELGTNPSTLTVTGEITANGGIALGDGDKATFGAGDDLQIYSDGSYSYIQESSGTSGIRITSDNQVAIRKHDDEDIAVFNIDGAVRFYHDNAQKFSTTSTGIDVTGTTTMDGLTVSSDSGGIVYLQDSNATATYNISELSNNGGNFGIQTRNSSGTFVSTDYQIVKNASGADYHRWFTQGSERMRIDSSGNLGINVTNPGAPLDIGAASPKIRLTDTGGGYSELRGNGGVLSLTADAGNTVANSAVTFETDGSEAMRIDSSGNVLVGKTSASSATVGFQAGQDGFVAATRASAQPLVLNRTTDDGTILDLRKDGTTVGSIGSAAGNLYIVSNDVGLNFAGGGDGIYPATADGAQRDAAIDLGHSSHRFKDLYLSGGVRGTSTLDITVPETSGGAIQLEFGNNVNDTRRTVRAYKDNFEPVAADDGVISLGQAANRWKDLYLSGTANVGGLAVDGGSLGNTGITNCDVQITRNRSSNIGLRTVSNGEVMRFVHTATDVGSIDITTSATSYNTSSDYRLKEDVQPMSGATDRLKELNPVNFAWKADGSRVDGFLAHEAQEVVPESVTGSKDAMQTEEYEVTPAVTDEEGNVTIEAVMGEREVPDYQGIDQSKLVPLLVATIQELEARITQLENN